MIFQVWMKVVSFAEHGAGNEIEHGPHKHSKFLSYENVLQVSIFSFLPSYNNA